MTIGMDIALKVSRLQKFSRVQGLLRQKLLAGHTSYIGAYYGHRDGTWKNIRKLSRMGKTILGGCLQSKMIVLVKHSLPRVHLTEILECVLS